MAIRKWWPLLLAAGLITVIGLLVFAGRPNRTNPGKIEVNIVPAREETPEALSHEEVMRRATETERRLVWYTSAPR
ncbi:MAG: hypothetical protein ACE5O2_13805, partial [Armatimonadota bacterium]